MKFSSIAAIVGGLAFLILAIWLSSDHPATFINLPGLLIVVGGTLTAIFVSYPVKEVIHALKQSHIVVEQPNQSPEREISQILHFSTRWFRKQMRQAEAEIAQLPDPFLKRGLQRILDKQDLDETLAFLNWRIAQFKSREVSTIGIYRSLSTFSPAFGMVGSLIGLVNMLQEFGSGNMVSITSNMAVALVTTFYGLLLANLFFKPIASKLEQRMQTNIMRMSLLAEGIVLIHQHKTPSETRDTLMAFAEQFQNDAPLSRTESKSRKTGFSSGKGIGGNKKRRQRELDEMTRQESYIGELRAQER